MSSRGRDSGTTRRDGSPRARWRRGAGVGEAAAVSAIGARRPGALAVAVAAGLLSGCQGCLGFDTSPLDTDSNALPRACRADLPELLPQKLDILFVVDDSNSMREEQEAVADEATTFIEELTRSGGIRQDFQVGVITTSVYQQALVGGVVYAKSYPSAGRLRPVPLPLPDGGVDLEGGDERILRGDDPSVVEKFSRLVRQGVQGSGQETPFEALRLALLTELADRPVGEGGNGGFLRDGARLLVVILTDEDDCSERTRPPTVALGLDLAVADCTEKAAQLTPVREYFDLFFQGLDDGLGRRREVLWTAIAPVAPGTKQAAAVLVDGRVRNVDCPSSYQAGFRHRELASLVDPSLSNLESICQDSFRETLLRIAGLAAVSQVAEVRGVADPRLVQIALSRADGSAQVCTLENGGLALLEHVAETSTVRLRFQGDCLRRATDTRVEIRLVCVT